MKTSDQEIPERLLEYLRETLGDRSFTYAEPPKRILKGVESRVYEFQLNGATGQFSSPLILKIFPEHDDADHARYEGTVQNALAELGYPVPRAVLSGARTSVLGGPFLMMRRLSGRVTFEMSITFSSALPLAVDAIFRMPRRLAELQADLHALNPSPVVRALEAASLQAVTAHERLNRLRRRVEQGSLEGLKDGVAWLFEHYPGDGRAVICHGDFWPGNLVMLGREVSGVIDWSMATLADPAFDVGITSVAMLRGVLQVPRALRWLDASLRHAVVRRYLASYRRSRPLDQSLLEYFQLFRCVDACSWVAERRLGLPGVLRSDSAPNPWDFPGSTDGFVEHFHSLTGVMLRLPAEPLSKTGSCMTEKSNA